MACAAERTEGTDCWNELPEHNEPCKEPCNEPHCSVMNQALLVLTWCVRQSGRLVTS